MLQRIDQCPIKMCETALKAAFWPRRSVGSAISARNADRIEAMEIPALDICIGDEFSAGVAIGDVCADPACALVIGPAAGRRRIARRREIRITRDRVYRGGLRIRAIDLHSSAGERPIGIGRLRESRPILKLREGRVFAVMLRAIKQQFRPQIMQGRNQHSGPAGKRRRPCCFYWLRILWRIQNLLNAALYFLANDRSEGGRIEAYRGSRSNSSFGAESQCDPSIPDTDARSKGDNDCERARDRPYPLVLV